MKHTTPDSVGSSQASARTRGTRRAGSNGVHPLTGKRTKQGPPGNEVARGGGRILDRDEIRRRRDARGWSVADAARAAGWPHHRRSLWNQIEDGTYDPANGIPLRVLAEIAAALRCHPGDLLRVPS